MAAPVYEACVLGSLNVARYLKDPGIDFSSLAEDIKTAVRFLDDTIDANIYPLPAIELMHKGNRKIGLGVMGWADLLLRLGLPYNNPQSFALARTVMKFVGNTSRKASAELAEERGVSPNFAGSVYDAPDRPRVRNATTTTIAPTGPLATALEIPAADHIEMQAAFQEYTDNAVSKTVNLPARATRGDVAKAFLLAYEKGVKGITVFRYGSKKGTLVKFVDTD